MSSNQAVKGAPRFSRYGGLSQRRSSAFTLVELLVAASIGSLIFASAAALITSHIRSTFASGIAQRVRDDSNRVSYFIQTEANEAALVETGQSLSACTGATGTSIFSLVIPRPDGVAGDTANVVRSHYYVNNGNLWRCGPSVNRNGSLNYGAITNSILNSETAIAPVSCQGITMTSGGRVVAYQATFNDAPSGIAPPCAIARAKWFFVVDP
jgi:type II secretory pathway pseudopilin PulG